MKTKNTFLFAALLVIVCAGGWSVGAMLADSDEAPAAPTKTVVTQPVTPVVVSPSANFDLEVSSPAEMPADELVDLNVTMPVPDLTWYDPHGLEDVGGIS